MGNRCMRPAPEPEAFTLLSSDRRAAPNQEPAVHVDWDDEKSVHHRSAMNSLHNYAIGKMGHLEPSEDPEPASPTTPQRASLKRPASGGGSCITFAVELHQTFHFERHSIECEQSGEEVRSTLLPDADHRDDTGSGCCPSPIRRSNPPVSAANSHHLSNPSDSPTSSEFVNMPADRMDAQRRACSASPQRRHCPDGSLPHFPGPADLPADKPADFPRIE
jgi:hypothetical protein